MRCSGWVSLAVLLTLCSLRRADCFVRVPVRGSPCDSSTRHRCDTLRRRSSWRPRSPRAQASLRPTSCGRKQEQRLQPIRSRSPELDTQDAPADTASDPNDPDLTLAFAMESALDLLGGSTQWVVAGSVGATLLQRADSATLVWVVGSLFNAVFSKVLKKGINQVRPDGSRLKDPGMPSSHAMSLFFLGAYAVIGIQEHGVVDCPIPGWPLGVYETQVLLASYAFTASLWRVKAGLHTLPQVVVGAVVGTVDAALWYRFCSIYFTSQVEAFFGGPDVPIEVAIGICLVTFLTFGNAQRSIARALDAQTDSKEV